MAKVQVDPPLVHEAVIRTPLSNLEENRVEGSEVL